MKAVFLKMAGSMKFWTMLLAIVAHIGVKYGLELSLETQIMVASFFVMLLGGQALQDQGKEAAKINSNMHAALRYGDISNDNQMAHAAVGLSGVTVTVTGGDADAVDDETLAAFGWMKKPKEAKPSTPLTGVVALFVAIAFTLSACAWWNSTGKELVRDCTTANAKSLTSEFGDLFELAITRATGGDGEVDYNSLKSSTASFVTGSGTCVALNTLAKLKAKKADPNAPQSGGVVFSDTSLSEGIALFADGKPVKTLYGAY